MFPSLTVNNFINSKTRVCSFCNERFIVDSNKENQKCPNCDTIFNTINTDIHMHNSVLNESLSWHNNE